MGTDGASTELTEPDVLQFGAVESDGRSELEAAAVEEPRRSVSSQRVLGLKFIPPGAVWSSGAALRATSFNEVNVARRRSWLIFATMEAAESSV